MKINEQINNTAYKSINGQQKNESQLNTQQENTIKKSFDISILHQNSATTYDSNEAKIVLKDINFEKEAASFSKDSLEGFVQPLTQAQAHLSSHNVHQLLQ